MHRVQRQGRRLPFALSDAFKLWRMPVPNKLQSVFRESHDTVSNKSLPGFLGELIVTFASITSNLTLPLQ